MVLNMFYSWNVVNLWILEEIGDTEKNENESDVSAIILQYFPQIYIIYEHGFYHSKHISNSLFFSF